MADFFPLAWELKRAASSLVKLMDKSTGTSWEGTPQKFRSFAPFALFQGTGAGWQDLASTTRRDTHSAYPGPLLQPERYGCGSK